MSNVLDELEEFSPVFDRFLPDVGEGETKGQQLVTAVNKIIYKWYNDGDVYDNTGMLEGWANDLSSYANWIYKYVVEARPILDRVFDCSTEDDYEELLLDLAEATLDGEDVENLDKLPKVGSIYDCDGPFEFKEYDKEDEEDYSWEDEDEEEYYEDEEVESSVDINAATDDSEDPLEDAMRDLKDDFDFLIQGLEKLQRSGGEDYNTGVEIARSFSSNIQNTIASISERFSTEEVE